MAGYYLKEFTVPIPENDKRVVIRKGKTIEYEIDRTYLPESGDTRVQRRVIGKADPMQPGRMFPSEVYFEVFPDNEIPDEIRDEFLRACEIKRQMKEIRKNPEEIIDGVVRGLEMLNQGAFLTGNGGDSLFRSPFEERKGPSPCSPLNEEGKMEYTMLRRLFDEIYYAVEELAGKFPNEVIAPFKVERINEVLEGLREFETERRGQSLSSQFCDESNSPLVPHLRLVEEGLTYSDVLILMKWYKVLPR